MRTILFSKLTVGFVGITVLALLLATVNLYQTSALSSPTSAKSIDTNYTLEDRDPNETNEIIQIYWNGIILMRENNWDNAKSWFEINLLSYPDSRHLHEGLAEVLWYLANNKPTDTSLLESASGEIIRAVTIGFDFGKVRHTWLLAQILGRSGNTNTLDNIFKQALLIDPAYTTYLHYAFGLTILNDSRAEVIYKQAIELQPEGNVDGLASYGEWLLDHHRYSEVIVLLPKDAHIEYLHFLRGVAFEQLKLIDDAKSEYAQFIEFSMIFPAPIQYRIKGSIAQTGIHFEGDLFINVTEIQARVGLSTLIYGEASGESTGGQRAEGWRLPLC
jgi:tetratricopeptide (TPR) repeat protein